MFCYFLGFPGTLLYSPEEMISSKTEGREHIWSYSRAPQMKEINH